METTKEKFERLRKEYEDLYNISYSIQEKVWPLKVEANSLVYDIIKENKLFAGTKWKLIRSHGDILFCYVGEEEDNDSDNLFKNITVLMDNYSAHHFSFKLKENVTFYQDDYEYEIRISNILLVKQVISDFELIVENNLIKEIEKLKLNIAELEKLNSELNI